MIEVTGNLWAYQADVRVITTNGTVKKDGTCVMGRGCAFEAKRQCQGIDKRLGEAIRDFGNITQVIFRGNPLVLQVPIVAFPVKHQWFQQADIDLIRNSTWQLRDLTRHHGWNTVVMPRPGCGNGKLDWAMVRPVLEPILDDRFHVITF